jgi:hypothetical protein
LSGGTASPLNLKEFAADHLALHQWRRCFRRNLVSRRRSRCKRAATCFGWIACADLKAYFRKETGKRKRRPHAAAKERLPIAPILLVTASGTSSDPLYASGQNIVGRP